MSSNSISLDIKSVLGALVIGLVSVFGLAWISGSAFVALPFPVLSVLSGFILTGMAAGLLSKGETIAEPGISSVLVSIALYFFLPGLHLQGFADLTPELMLTVGMNGVLLSFAGAWGWVLAGTILGIMVTILMSTLFIVLFGLKTDPQFIGFVIGLLSTGFIIGFRSPGITIKEAALAGFFALVIDLDVLTIALVPPSFDGIMISLVLGTVLAMVGAWIGEKVQG
jgi:hypothetical protein